MSEVTHPEEVEHPDPSRRDAAAAWVADKCATVEFALANLIFSAVWMVVGIETFPYSGLTLALSIEAILLAIFVLVQQRLEKERQERESAADLKNDAIAAEAAEEVREQLNRIEKGIKSKWSSG